MESKFFPLIYEVVSAATLQISVSFKKRRKSLIKILKRIGPSINLATFRERSLRKKQFFIFAILDNSGSILNYCQQLHNTASLAIVKFWLTVINF